MTAKAAVTRTQAAEMYSVEERVISAAIRSGALPAADIGSGNRPVYRILVTDLADWFASLPRA